MHEQSPPIGTLNVKHAVNAGGALVSAMLHASHHWPETISAMKCDCVMSIHIQVSVCSSVWVSFPDWIGLTAVWGTCVLVSVD